MHKLIATLLGTPEPDGNASYTQDVEDDWDEQYKKLAKFGELNLENGTDNAPVTRGLIRNPILLKVIYFK